MLAQDGFDTSLRRNYCVFDTHTSRHAEYTLPREQGRVSRTWQVQMQYPGVPVLSLAAAKKDYYLGVSVDGEMFAVSLKLGDTKEVALAAGYVRQQLQQPLQNFTEPLLKEVSPTRNMLQAQAVPQLGLLPLAYGLSALYEAMPQSVLSC